MTLIRTPTLLCDRRGCDWRWEGRPGQTGQQAREAASVEGWSYTESKNKDKCPQHPQSRRSVRDARAKLLRIYGREGRLLYVATTRGTPRARLRSLVRQDWWFLADVEATLVDILPADADSEAERERVVKREHPKFYRDADGNHPYLRHTKHIEPVRVGTALSRLQEKRGRV